MPGARVAAEIRANRRCTQEARAQQPEHGTGSEQDDADAAAVAAAAAAVRHEDAPDAWDAETSTEPVCAFPLLCVVQPCPLQKVCMALTYARGATSNPPAVEAREQVCRVLAAVRALAELFLAIHPESIVGVADAAIAWGVPPRDMCGEPFLRRLADREAARRLEAAGGADAGRSE